MGYDALADAQRPKSGRTQELEEQPEKLRMQGAQLGSTDDEMAMKEEEWMMCTQVLLWHSELVFVGGNLCSPASSACAWSTGQVLEGLDCTTHYNDNKGSCYYYSTTSELLIRSRKKLSNPGRKRPGVF